MLEVTWCAPILHLDHISSSIQKLKHPLHSFQVRLSGAIYFEAFRGMWQIPPLSGQCIKMTYKEDVESLLSNACCDRARENGFKLKEDKFKVDKRKRFFIMRMMGHWNGFCKEQAGWGFEQLNTTECILSHRGNIELDDL